jgi:long-chain acyl-CoA synthetase
VVEAAAARWPDREALVCGGDRLTYGELDRRATALCRGLRALGVERGEGVAAMLPNCTDLVLSFLAAARLGAVFVPVDIYHRRPELERLLEDGEVSALIVGPELGELAGQARSNVPRVRHLVPADALEGLSRAARGVGPGPAAVRPRDELLYLHTSGTTGRAKGVLLGHERAIAIGRAWRAELDLRGDDRCYTLAPLFRSPALLSVVVGGLWYGIPMVIPPGFRPERVWDELAAERVTLLHANPYHYALLANAPPGPTGPIPLRRCYSTGNRLPPAVARKFVARFGVPIEERYGTSEAGGISSNGRPLRGVRIRIVGRDGRRLGPNELGEVAVRTPVMADGYRGRPDLTRESFRGGWFHTGDLGRIDAHGRLEIVRRKKTVVLSGGREVYADEVEQVILSHPKVREAMVIRAEPGAGAALVALVVLRGRFTVEKLRGYCSARLADHKLPLFEARRELPRSWKAVARSDYPRWGEV